MLGTDELLTAIETCERAAYWSQRWERAKITPNQLLEVGIREGLLTNRPDFGECAGEAVIACVRDREILTDCLDVYSLAINAASLADIICVALRKPAEGPWRVPESITFPDGQPWITDVFLAPSGQSLRRVVLATNWSDERHASFCRSWETIGNICAYSMPMQLAVVILGAMRGGKRHGPLSKGLRHPKSRELRFRKRNDVKVPFKDSWEAIFREDFSDIPTADWLSSMNKDGVLQDVCFSVTVDVPNEATRKHFLDLASRKLDHLERMETVPDEQLTGCSWPVKCQFIKPCHAGAEPSGKYGFYKIT